MSRTECARPFRKNEQRASRSQQFQALVQRVNIRSRLAFVFLPDHFDSGKKQPSHHLPAQLPRDHEIRPRQNRVIDESVHRAVSMQPQIKRWTASRQPFRARIKQFSVGQVERDAVGPRFLHIPN